MSDDFIDPHSPAPTPGWQRTAGFISLLLAAALTVGTALLLLLPENTEEPTPEPTTAQATVQAVVPTQTSAPTSAPQVVVGEGLDLMPTVSAETIAALLNSEAVPAINVGIQTVRNPYDPFTIIPDRPRSEVIEYTIVEGDTIFSIAERFGLAPETIAWSNDRSIIGNLRPGRAINIMPVDGVYHTVIGTRTLAEIAAGYGITDPYVIIDSEYNDLFGVTPDTVLHSGTEIAIPGGVAEQITWNPVVEREGGDNSSGGSFVSFAPGEPGSCGRVNNAPGTFWSSPISSYTFTRGFTSWHTGVDLAAQPGTPVMAANGGVVIFAGWSNWGYGNTIVLSHGPFTTLYGHLSSINVGCAQVISAGQVIGGVGSSGNSSGPHLHFEIRYLDVPQNPTATLPF
ncbi:MAG: M23 family metallopeptidase [Anaerolineae bacterium]|nr:M23 family metallopeptidase [Anaerolineae bacterium]